MKRVSMLLSLLLHEPKGRAFLHTSRTIKASKTSMNNLLFSSKKLINSPSTVVSDYIDGLLLTDHRLQRIEGIQAVLCGSHLQPSHNQVKVLSGGGSGHEPAHAGYIGDGMLSGAILGNVFASPSVNTILAAIRVCANPKGVLLVVKNYTGDRINFGMAIERARSEGILVRMLIVDDDCALAKDKGITGGRGIAGTVFVHKIAGAAALSGYSLDEVYTIAKEAVDSTRSMGIALSTCTVPGAATSSRLDGDIMEIGLGIHGEQGREQAPFPKENAAADVAGILVDAIVDGKTLSSGNSVAILINNLGTTPSIELLIVAKEIITRIKRAGLTTPRVYVGSFMTALDMAGVSLSVFKTSPKMLELLDAPSDAPAWMKCLNKGIMTAEEQIIKYEATEVKVKGGPSSKAAAHVVEAICRRIIAIEPKLTEYDRICGDGDCGLVMKAGASSILAAILDGQLFDKKEGVRDGAALCEGIADIISASMGGTSGGLLELMMRAMATHLATNGKDENVWAEAFSKGVEAVQFYGGATAGMRTMLDAMIPAAKALKSEGLSAASLAAKEGASSTAHMISKAGRSNYLSEESIDGTPDPGAVAVAESFDAVVGYFKG